MAAMLLSILGVLLTVFIVTKYKQLSTKTDLTPFLLLGIAFTCVLLAYFNVSNYLYLIHLISAIAAAILIFYYSVKIKQRIPILVSSLWLLTLIIQLLNLPFWGIVLIIQTVVFVPLIAYILLSKSSLYDFFTKSWMALTLVFVLINVFNYFG